MGFLDYLEYFLWGAAAAAAACLVVSVAVEITQDVIRRRAKEKFERAKYALVKEIKNAKKVKVGIFGNNSNELGELVIESDKGVDKNVRVGQKIYV